MTKPSEDNPSGQPLGLPLNDLLGPTQQRIKRMAEEAGARFHPRWGFASSVEVATFERFATAVVDEERERWRAIAHRVAADANRYGREGLRMHCTISDNGGLVSWEVDRA